MLILKMAAAGTAEDFLYIIVRKWKYGKRESGKGDGTWLLFTKGSSLDGSMIHVHIGVDVDGTNLFCHITDPRINPVTGKLELWKKTIDMTVEPNSQGRDAVIAKCLSVIPDVIKANTLDLALGGVTGKITIIWPEAAQAAPAQAAPAPKYKYKCEICETEYIWSDHGDTFMSGCMNCSKKGSSSKKRFTRGDKEGKRRKSGRKSGRQSRRKLGRKSRQ